MIVDRYLLRQMLWPLTAVIIVLSSLFAIFTLARLLADAGAGLLDLSEVIRVTWFRWLIAQDVLIPIALYLATILVWGRLHQDLEMDALAAGGFAVHRLMWSTVGLALILSLLVVFITTEIRPWAWKQVYQVKAEAEASAELDRIRSGRFNLYGSDFIVFIERIKSGGNLEGVFVRGRKTGEFEVLSAATGHFEPYIRNDTHQLKLFDALAFQEFEDSANLFGKFDTLTLNLQAATPRSVTDKPKVKSVSDLTASGDPEDDAELQWRLSAPVSTLLLALVAIPLARTRPRESRYARVILALLVYAVYFNLIGVARTWVEQQRLTSIIWVHLALIAFIALMWWRRARAR